MCSSSEVAAKRAAPPVAAPIVVAGTRFAAVHERTSSNGKPKGLRAYIEARDAADKPLWRTLAYDIVYDQAKETDVQDSYIRQLSAEIPGVLALREDGHAYLLDVKSRKARELPQTHAWGDTRQASTEPLINDGRMKAPAKCDRHGSTMKEDVVRIAYGLIRFDAKEAVAMRDRFPNANYTRMGGCVIRPVRWTLVNYCSDCRKAHDAFHKAGKTNEI